MLGGLHSLYDLRMISIDALAGAGVDLHQGPEQTDGARPRIRSATLPVVAAAAFPSHLDFPGGRMLLIPTGCNSRCTFCMVDEFIETNDHHGRPRGEGPLAELRALVEELPPGHLVDFFGAEPTLHGSFFALLQAAAERGLGDHVGDQRQSLLVGGLHPSGRRLGAAAPTGADQHSRRHRRGPRRHLPRARQLRPDAQGRPRPGGRGLRGPLQHGPHARERPPGSGHRARGDRARGEVDEVSGLVDLERNAGSFVPYDETANAVEAFCSVCEQRQVPYEIEKLPLCVAPRRMHHFVFEQGIFPTDRGVMTGLGNLAATVWCATSATVWSRLSSPPSASGLRTVRAGARGGSDARGGDPRAASRSAPLPGGFYPCRRPRPAVPGLGRVLRFKQRCEGEVGDLCVERGAAS